MSNTPLIKSLGNRRVLRVTDCGDRFLLEGKNSEYLSWSELLVLSQELKEIACAKIPEVAEGYFAIAEEAFRSLSEAEGCSWEKRIRKYSFEFAWDFNGSEVFLIQGEAATFRSFVVTCYGFDDSRIEIFESSTFAEVIDVLLSRSRKVIALKSALDKILDGKDRAYCDRVMISSRGGYSAICRIKDESEDKDAIRSIEVAVGPSKIFCDRGSHEIEDGKAVVLLTHFPLGGDEVDRVCPYDFDSEEEAIAFFRENVGGLCDPVEFDRVCQ